MTTITLQQAQSVIPGSMVHIFAQTIESIRVLKGQTIPRAEADELLANAEAISIDDTIIDKHPVPHGISIKMGKGLIYFQTVPAQLSALREALNVLP